MQVRSAAAEARECVIHVPLDTPPGNPAVLCGQWGHIEVHLARCVRLELAQGP